MSILALGVLLFTVSAGNNGSSLSRSLQDSAKVPGAERPIRWSGSLSPTTTTVARGGLFRVALTASIPEGWKLYSLTQPAGGPRATTIRVAEPYGAAGAIKAPVPDTIPDRNFNLFTEVYHERATFMVPVRAPKVAQPGQPLRVIIAFQTCTDRYCLPPRTDTVLLAVQVAGGHPAAPPDGGLTVTAAIPSAPTTELAPVAFVAPTDMGSLVRFVWLAITMGLLALLTPCILPMIPITIGFFGAEHQASPAAQRRRVLRALAHAAGIIGSFVTLGLMVSAAFGAAGVMRLASSPWLNLGVAFLFAAFALNLFGAFEITLPSTLLTRLSAKTTTHGTGAALLMGVVFAITSFTCTAPFVGTLLVLATQGTWRWPLIGLGAYATAFALPFFLIALAPGLLARLPRAGPWMTVVKRALALLEFAMAAKFLSNADLVLGWGIVSRDVVIGIWIAASLGVAVVLIAGMSSRGRATGRGVLLAGAAVAVAMAGWMGTGLRGARLAELEAYLPPRLAVRGAVLSPRGDAELPWRMNDLAGGLALSRVSGRPVLVDFTGYTCTNCRWMEANMFPRDEVRNMLDRYVLVRLFTDGIGEPYESQQSFQQRRFGTVALPYYAVLRPDGSATSTFLGMTRDRFEFVRFLEEGLRGSAVTTRDDAPIRVGTISRRGDAR